MIDIKIQNNISLLNYTTIKVGGQTEYFSEPNNTSELENIINWVSKNNINCQIFGAGSNLLISGKKLKGLLICTKKLKSINLNPETGMLEAECGVMLPTISSLLAKNCCKGGEWSIGIPGTVGGAIFMNAGYGDFAISNHLISVKVIDKNTLKTFEILKKDLAFNYRFSSFQENKLIILSAKFYFEPGGDKSIITEATKENLKKKTDSQPYHLPSFGSVFKNPKNYYAAKLIEESGLKGFKLGGAQVSKMHANFIVNHLDASSEDIYQLISLIQQEVQQKKGIFLHPEVRMIGF
tara:strand:+ start:1530 stop:2411 length:882 start_codon:yes stop_codon:yes gene_type:complete